MKFKIGDKVRFLNEKGEGIVSKIINKTTVGVTIEDGFELPFLINELVSIFDEKDIKVSIEQKKIEEPAPVYRSAVNERKEKQEGLYLGISPEQPNNISHSDFNLWLINHTSYDILFCASLLGSKGFEAFDKGELKAFESKLIETISKKSIDLYSGIKIDAIFQSEKPFEHQTPVSEIVKIKSVKLYKENAFVQNNFIPEKALIINVSDFGTEELFFEKPESKKIDLSKLLFQKKTSSQTVKVSKPHRINNSAFEMEIDLHIEELQDNYKGMSNAEIIQVQIRHFQKALDEAINEHYRSLTVIHGVGNGRLKQEVHKILNSMRLRYHDGSYSKYGFGATEILIS